jgi:transposase-like protein
LFDKPGIGMQGANERSSPPDEDLKNPKFAIDGDVLVSQGQSMADAIRQIGVSEVTFYRWRQEFGGLKIEQVKRLKDLELENSRLRKAVSDLTLDKLILQEASRGNY